MPAESHVTYPLPEHMLPKVTLSKAEEDDYRTLSRTVVQKTLEEELEFRRFGADRQLPDHKWKFVKAKDRLKVYKQLPPARTPSRSRSNSGVIPTPPGVSPPPPSPPKGSQYGGVDGRAIANPLGKVVPMVVAFGKIDGTLEDAIYGVHHKTTEEMRITTSFLNKHHIDSAVLHTIDRGTDADPFRYLGIKWRLTQSPGGKIIYNRDACVLEHMGVDVDAKGGKYAFHMIKSLELPWFPALPDPQVIRARLMLCCIYRQVAPGVVHMYIKGVFNLGGDLPDFIAYNKAADTLLALAHTVDCSEAKRLTLQIIKRQRDRLRTFRVAHVRGRKDEVVLVDRDASTVTESDEDQYLDGADEDNCSLCTRHRGLLGKIGSGWDRCRICEQPVCPKCYVKKTVFATPCHLRVPCCKACIMDCKQISVDPRDPYPVIGNLVDAGWQ
ncbi:hypothetical protein Poli38472_007309 [Pythium oligandrum]|uniref:START-like domain n=1 Tax=Pythium oligandrum TaxID=41045 RepID=A0A8K1C9X7_PYTOL|nr:hypothetical protein Poli38472_007309 [Pythium oligandrum]|eukprot:TMW59164.1 hypothetical protein Poli38472_007309 [Pythium oligandrum]